MNNGVKLAQVYEWLIRHKEAIFIIGSVGAA